MRDTPVPLVGPQVGGRIAQPGSVIQTGKRWLARTRDVDHPLAVDHVAEEPVVSAGHVEHALRDIQVPVGLGFVKGLGGRIALRRGKQLKATDKRVENADNAGGVVPLVNHRQLADRTGQAADRLEH